MWRTEETPHELGWTILVLILKETTNIRGIDLRENLWKVVEALLETCLRASLKVHNVLHRLRYGRGTGMAITELKLAHEISSIDQDPLFLVFLDLRKEYDTVDRDHLLIK